MIKTDSVDAIEAMEIVLVWGVVAMPRDNVQRGVVELRGPEVAEKLGDHLKAAFIAIVECSVRRQEVAARIGLGFEIPEPSFVPNVPKTPELEAVSIAA